MLDKNGFILHPHLKSPMDIRKTVYSFMYNTVITLKPEIQEKIDQMKERLHWNDYYWIGLQIRTGKLGAGDAAGHFLDNRDYDLFTRIALEKTYSMTNKTAKPVKWYVACDNKLLIAKLKSTYPQFFTTSSCTISHSSSEINRATRSSPMMCTLLDSYLLSSVDEAIITAKSTFGILSVNRKPKMKRVLIMKGDWKKYKKLIVSYESAMEVSSFTIRFVPKQLIERIHFLKTHIHSILPRFCLLSSKLYRFHSILSSKQETHGF